MQIGSRPTAKFTHESGVGLRLQAFLAVRDERRRIACARLETDPAAWVLPGESMWLNEAPDDAAARVARTWFATPVEGLRLAAVESWPATGPGDDRWYLVFVYEARPVGALAGTPDTLEIAFAEPGKAPGPWGFSHGDVWSRLS